MDKSKYWRSLTSQEKQALADKLAVTKVYLSNVFNGFVKCSAPLAKKIDKETNGAVTKEILRPDYYE